MKYKLGFDVDEVVCKTIKTILWYMKDLYAINWSYENFNKYSFEETEFVKNNKVLNKRIADDLIGLVNDPNVHFSFDPYDEAIKYINKYKMKGHSIHFVSNRPLDKEDWTIKWLKKQGILFDSVHHAGWKINKGVICDSLNLDFYVDDHTKCLDSLLDYKKKWKKGLFLIDRPWNKGYENGSVVRIYNWKELDKHLNL